MKLNAPTPINCLIAAIITAATLLTASTLHAADTDLADIPLANATTVDILPNIMFVLDDSGSMDWDFMPDYVTDSYCRGTGTSLTSCEVGDPPYYLSSFNGVYYNPMINYTPPLNADGTSKTDYTTWTAVPKDGYGVQFSGTTNLVTSYPERVACDNAGDDVNDTALCKSLIDGSNAYSYPNSTFNNIKTRYGAPFYYTATVEWCSARETVGSGLVRFGKAPCQSKKDSTFKYPRYSSWQRINIVPATTSYNGPNSTTRTYAQEMTNFANWYAWYRTRMQMMKSGVGRAFANIRGQRDSSDPLDKNYFHARVGFTTISSENATDGSKFLKINYFNTTQKNTWFSRLYAINPSSGTPLLGALAKAGRIYAGQLGEDPVQYSCQRNFTILSTDGYWNSVTSSYGPTKDDGSTTVGDQDGASGVTRPSYDALTESNTLADVAYYYYHTDLRSGLANNVTPSGTNQNEDDVATHQHMTTFTVGLGVNGTLAFQDGYKNSTSGDYYDIKQGTKNWPDPINNSAEERIDDLWHAAVNGRGTYFSARDPDSLVTGLTAALGAMESASGSGAAAATSNLQPTAGDNYIYIANYRTVTWDGELGAYTIDLSTGAVSATATWQANTPLQTKISSTGDSDTRSIYTSTGATLRSFNWAELTSTEKTYFDNTKLSQYSDWSTADQTAATGELMVKYLRGHDRYEDQDRTSGYGSYNRLYRDREKLLGDIVHSQPVYVADPLYNYTENAYSSFKSAQASRSPTIYVGANDGMLHAFNANDGTERWAYVPPMVIKNLWLLADKGYATNHRFFLDGPIAVSDVFISGGWKTILVGSLGKGGRGYYALDITNPSTPAPLWTFTADDNPNVGYTYGTPLITKVDGVWSVLVPSGHNNVPEGSNYSGADGEGRLFVLNAATGAVTKTIATGVGSVGSPSGLARINMKVDIFESENAATAAYGGDLHGNLWRFDLSGGTASKVMSLGVNKPIAVAPEIGEIDGKTILMFGTGRYLGQDDLDDVSQQAIYAVRDDGSTTVSTGSLVEQTFSGSGSSTTSTTNAVDWATSYGWYANLPITGERITLDPQLFFGTVIFASTIPAANECQPGGYGRVYQIDYFNGATLSVTQFVSPPVGVTVAKLPGGTAKIYVIEARGGVPATPPTLSTSSGAGSGSGSGNRVMWRELLN